MEKNSRTDHVRNIDVLQRGKEWNVLHKMNK
jgi:hypothetical protein